MCKLNASVEGDEALDASLAHLHQSSAGADTGAGA